MKHICLFGGPGVGKSTISSGLFNLMKRKGYSVEYITEYAKSLTYSKSTFRLSDQLYILAKQHHPWFVLNSQIDYTVNDSPFILGLAYTQETEHLPLNEFKNLIISMYKTYDTLNIFLDRDPVKIYQEVGRNQTLNQAIVLDNIIKNILTDNNIPFTCITSSDTSVDEIYNLLLSQ